MLQPGDLLHVGARDDNPVYVMGEVNKPLAVPLRDGSLTLSAALSEAGQLNQQTSNAQQVSCFARPPTASRSSFTLT